MCVPPPGRGVSNGSVPVHCLDPTFVCLYVPAHVKVRIFLTESTQNLVPFSCPGAWGMQVVMTVLPWA